MRHQSQLEIQSELGKGSRFSARFSSRRLSAALSINPPVASNRGNQGLQAAK
jgi:hypothetical protein